jgi:hypothetical protein
MLASTDTRSLESLTLLYPATDRTIEGPAATASLRSGRQAVPQAASLL